MFTTETYVRRREGLRQMLGDGAALILGGELQPRNYRDNPYPFRAASHFLYYAGLSRPGLALVIGPTASEDMLFGPPEGLDDVVWHGAQESLVEGAARAGIGQTRDISELASHLDTLRGSRRRVHHVAPYRADDRATLGSLLGLSDEAVVQEASAELARAIVKQRSIKSLSEIAEIEDALTVTAAMHREAARRARPGAKECEIAGAIQGVALARDRAQAYNPIVTTRGEVLHNHSYGNRLEAGRLLLNDSGAESPRFYASDITRTIPIGGKFTPQQREIYEVVLAAQTAAIQAMKPGVAFRDLHLTACRTLTDGLKALGLMRGDTRAAVEAGAHALFFPHGLGHMLGLDVHDMEDLGDLVGYGEGEPRSPQFGLNFLRLARPLEAGFVVTIEPGLYFIPALIERWRGERVHSRFINYDRVEGYRDFGGIRIEDDVLCTEKGARVLGPSIPKTVAEIEAWSSV